MNIGQWQITIDLMIGHTIARVLMKTLGRHAINLLTSPHRIWEQVSSVPQ